ncbi:hypothetical protein P9443_19115 [Peribacillus frigoritolerans]|uniref:hypothetical protein n=1 Tax=Peribacillus frigoritolerans TaxID=450367 RepID=UPI002E202A85|nr:hypothetical protein [Peribacillus frigoritolerans]
MNKYKDIHAKFLAEELQMRGHALFKVVPNRKNTDYKVYVFRNTPEFDNDLTEINKRRKLIV